MPRTARLIMDNVCYHVITRGNERKKVFKKSEDYYRYLEILSRYKRRCKFRLYGWCLMENHVHLLIESKKLSRIMHGINLTYAQYFINTYNTCGHFWQDRFKSFVVQKDQYLINCLMYIECNPVRANLVKGPEDYRWSSYHARVLGQDDGLLDVGRF